MPFSVYESQTVDSCPVDAWPRPVGLRCVQQRTLGSSCALLPCMSAWRGHKSANTSSHTPKGRSLCEDLCSRASAGRQATSEQGVLWPSAHPGWPAWVCCLSCSWKEDAFSQLFKKEERKLYSANKLLTLNDSLISMAQLLLPQFSVSHMKHKISFLSSKPFLIEIGEIVASQN